jgi:hypothetical protein
MKFTPKITGLSVNVCFALRLFGTLPVAVSEVERTFSKWGNWHKPRKEFRRPATPSFSLALSH